MRHVGLLNTLPNTVGLTNFMPHDFEENGKPNSKENDGETGR